MFSGSGIKSEKHKIGSTINGDLIMKLRDKILYMSFGAGLVVLGMILNSLVSGDADAQEGVKDVEFGYITCKGLIIRTEDKVRGYFGLDSGGDAILEISDDDGERPVAYLGKNTSKNDEMIFQLQSKSKIDKRQVMMMIGENGGRFDSLNKIGESVNSLEVGSSSGSLDVRVKYENKK